MVETHIGSCGASPSKPHVVNVVETTCPQDGFLFCFSVTYYGMGKVGFGLDYYHVNEPRRKLLPPCAIPLTMQQVQHIISGAKGVCGDIEVVYPEMEESDDVLINRLIDGDVVFSIPLSAGHFHHLQDRAEEAIKDFELMGPYTNPGDETLMVTDKRVQRNLIMGLLRQRYYFAASSASGRGTHLEVAKFLVQTADLDAINRWLERTGLKIQCEEGFELKTLFEDIDQTARDVMEKNIPVSTEYFRHVTACPKAVGSSPPTLINTTDTHPPTK